MPAWLWAEGAAAPAAIAASAAPAVHPTFVKGGNVSAWNTALPERVFADARRLGLDTITVPVRVNMSAATAADARVDAASLAFAKQLIAREPGYRYIIEPYPWIAGGTVPETDLDPANKPGWFAAYEGAVVELAKQFPQAWGLYVASNLVKLESQTPSWLALVRAVRGVYPGKVIYRTQWWATAQWEPSTLEAWRKKLENPVFGAVDIIAIAAYFELSELPSPSVAQLKAALRATTVFARKQDVYGEVMALQARWKKPIFLGELSCPAVDLGAQNPWDPQASDTPNGDIQRSVLTAYLETFAQTPDRFVGFSVFTIGHPTPTTYDLAPSAAEYVRAFKPPAGR